jgi:hypothetical protein
MASGVQGGMTGVAGDVIAVFVKMMIQQIIAVMGLFGMAVYALGRSLGCSHRRGLARNFMVSRFMAFCAGKVISAHVDVAGPAGGIELAAHIGVFDVIASSTGKMAAAAGFSAGWAHIAGNLGQIDVRIGHPGPSGRFCVPPCRVMAHQAVDVFQSRKVKAVVFPTVAGMA